MDSPISKKRWGTGICWDYMESGTCHCLQQVSGSHPTLTVEAAAAASKNNNISGRIAATTSISSGTVVIMPRRIPDWCYNLEYLGFIEGDVHNFATLQTSYEERNEVKTIGANYSAGMKKWIVAPGKNLQPFAKWHPIIHNRGDNEVVFHNIYLDLKSAVAALQRCGFLAKHIYIVGDDDEALAVRNELESTKKGRKGSNLQEPHSDDVMGRRKRTLNFASDDNTTTPSQSSSKRPCFSGPESMQAFVRMSQEEQRGEQNDPEEEERMMIKEGRSIIKRHGNISVLLTAAKSALVNCCREGSTTP